MSKVLVCENCQKDLSGPTEIIADLAANIDNRSPVENYHTPLGRTIHYTVDHKVYLDEPIGSTFYWMNGNDLLSRVRPVEGTTGCCGYSGTNNMQCACGNIVGTLYTDCCGPHFFSPTGKGDVFYC